MGVAPTAFQGGVTIPSVMFHWSWRTRTLGRLGTRLLRPLRRSRPKPSAKPIHTRRFEKNPELPVGRLHSSDADGKSSYEAAA